MTDNFELNDGEVPKQPPLRSFTSDEVRDFCVSIKKFTEALERQLIVGEMTEEHEACSRLFRAADDLQSLLP